MYPQQYHSPALDSDGFNESINLKLSSLKQLSSSTKQFSDMHVYSTFVSAFVSSSTSIKAGGSP